MVNGLERQAFPVHHSPFTIRHSPFPPALLALLLFLAVSPALAQEHVGDTSRVSVRALPERHSPRGALWRALALPGWGQLYNRQAYKLPVVYGGLAGFTGAALYQNRLYLRYRHAYLYAAYAGSGAENPYGRYQSSYARVTEGVAGGRDPASLAPALKQNRDNLRRNRDLLYIGIGLFYGLTVLDAYVNAHLLDFDVGEDLSLAVHPDGRGVRAVLRARR